MSLNLIGGRLRIGWGRTWLGTPFLWNLGCSAQGKSFTRAYPSAIWRFSGIELSPLLCWKKCNPVPPPRDCFIFQDFWLKIFENIMCLEKKLGMWVSCLAIDFRCFCNCHRFDAWNLQFKWSWNHLQSFFKRWNCFSGLKCALVRILEWTNSASCETWDWIIFSTVCDRCVSFLHLTKEAQMNATKIWAVLKD